MGSIKRNSKLMGLKYSKIIYCFVEIIIILLIIGSIIKISFLNDEIKTFSSISELGIECSLFCGKDYQQLDQSQCCQTTEQNSCVKTISKNICKVQYISILQQELRIITDNLTTLALLSLVFLIIQCTLDKIINFFIKMKRDRQQVDSHILKSNLLSTISYEESISSFDSFTAKQQKRDHSYLYITDEMACPVCLGTMQEQQVRTLNCKHIMHSTCAGEDHCCPICEPQLRHESQQF